MKKTNIRMDKLLDVKGMIVEQIKRYGGTFTCHTLYGEKHDYDFTVNRKNGTRKNLKVYTSSSDTNTALSTHLIEKSSIDYVVLCESEEEVIYVFDKRDVLNNGKTTRDGRIHFRSLLNNMDEFTILEARNNFKRVFLEF